jgi:hypothetical protein
VEGPSHSRVRRNDRRSLPANTRQRRRRLALRHCWACGRSSGVRVRGSPDLRVDRAPSRRMSLPCTPTICAALVSLHRLMGLSPGLHSESPPPCSGHEAHFFAVLTFMPVSRAIRRDCASVQNQHCRRDADRAHLAWICPASARSAIHESLFRASSCPKRCDVGSRNSDPLK